MATVVLFYIFAVVSVCVQHASGDYQCVCNYNMKTGVMSSPSHQGTPIGYMFEFDCKASIASLSTDQWLAIAFEHKIGYIPRDPQAQQQVCEGEKPPEDKVTTITAVTSPTPTTTPVQTTPSSRSTTIEPTTTPTTTTPKLATSSTTTPMPTTLTTVVTTNPTTPMPTTAVVATTSIPTSTATPQATQTTQSIFTSTAYVVSDSDGSSSVTSTTTPITTTALPHSIDPSGITAPGDIRQCPSTIASLAIRDNADLGYYQNSCYEFIPRAVNHEHAVSLCQSREGELVDILTANEQTFVEAFLQMYSRQHAVWTGLHDRDHENQFEWTSGATVKYTNWVPHHEDNFVSHNQEDCVLIVPYQYGQWDDVPCGGYGFFGGDSGEVHPLLCEYKLSHYSANAIIG